VHPATPENQIFDQWRGQINQSIKSINQINHINQINQINQIEKSSVSNDPICHCIDTSNQKYKNYSLV
jgi:hypothetical protein